MRKETIFGWSKLAVYSSLGLLVVILLVAAISYYAGRNQSPASTAIAPVIDLGNQRQVLGLHTYNWNGTITDITDNPASITLLAKYRDAGGVIQSKQVRTMITEDTVIRSWDVTTPTPDEDGLSEKSISISDLATGQQVTIQTDADIAESDHLTAQSITVLVSPTQ